MLSVGGGHGRPLPSADPSTSCELAATRPLIAAPFGLMPLFQGGTPLSPLDCVGIPPDRGSGGESFRGIARTNRRITGILDEFRDRFHKIIDREAVSGRT
jgi:hypothetical protein